MPETADDEPGSSAGVSWGVAPLEVAPSAPPFWLDIPLPDLRTTENIVPLPPVVAPARLWEGSFELGLNGSEGNNPAFDFRFGFDAKRKTPKNVFTFHMDYNKKNTREVKTVNRLFSESRYERLFVGTPWKCFTHGTFEYDELKPNAARVAGDVGVGRQLYKSDFNTVSGRLGAGVSHEFESPSNAYVPEAIFGLDFERQIGKRQKLVCSFDYMPDITGFNQYRLRTNANWEVMLDQEMKLSLKFNVLDRYDSTPEGAKANDLDYSAVLLWKF